MKLKPIYRIKVAKLEPNKCAIQTGNDTIVVGRRKAQQRIFESLCNGDVVHSELITVAGGLNGVVIAVFDRHAVDAFEAEFASKGVGRE